MRLHYKRWLSIRVSIDYTIAIDNVPVRSLWIGNSLSTLVTCTLCPGSVAYPTLSEEHKGSAMGRHPTLLCAYFRRRIKRSAIHQTTPDGCSWLDLLCVYEGPALYHRHSATSKDSSRDASLRTFVPRTPVLLQSIMILSSTIQGLPGVL